MNKQVFKNQIFIMGLIGILSLGVTLYGIFWLKEFKLRPAFSFYIRFIKAQRIAIGSPVVFKGVDIGKVKEIKLSDKLDSTLIKVDIKENIELSSELEAHIKDENLMGLKVLELSYPENTILKAESKSIKDGDIIEGGDSIGLMQIQAEILKLAKTINKKVATETITGEALSTINKINCMSEKVDYILSQEKPGWKMLFGHPAKDFSCEFKN